MTDTKKWVATFLCVAAIIGLGLFLQAEDKKWLDHQPQEIQEKILLTKVRLHEAPQFSFIIMKNNFTYETLYVKESMIATVVDCRGNHKELSLMSFRQIDEVKRVVYPTEEDYLKIKNEFSCEK